MTLLCDVHIFFSWVLAHMAWGVGLQANLAGRSQRVSQFRGNDLPRQPDVTDWVSAQRVWLARSDKWRKICGYMCTIVIF
ncbi:hypothetical protein QBC46DRAFT_16370 [Diplogelasinospora grovesii]|uniref:Secreted protein n=1 Tax=Diplogelasinospora grovesii TaxID=303347 RepID=A0AAN6S8T8_9PEZI|nr:hypothetical protein QBC46DRAFT_16370 [Diplogelasinospora grovesii]